MLLSGECCRWGRVRAGFALLEVHALDETVRDGIDVPHLAIRNDIATKAFHELINFHLGGFVRLYSCGDSSSCVRALPRRHALSIQGSLCAPPAYANLLSCKLAVIVGCLSGNALTGVDR